MQSTTPNIYTPRPHTAIITQKTWVSSRVLEITFEPTTPHQPTTSLQQPSTLPQTTPFTFKAGHLISLQVAPNTHRAYSIASDPARSPTFKIIVAAQHNGIGANFLKNTPLNTQVSFIGPSGKFFMQTPPAQNIIFLATGTGIAPFISFLFSLAQNHPHTNQLGITLYHGLRNTDEIFYTNILEHFKAKLNFDYFICLSQPSPTAQSQNNLQIPIKSGHITANYAIPDPQNTHVYLCGHPNMVEENIEKLLQNNVPAQNIFHEKFTHAKIAIV